MSEHPDEGIENDGGGGGEMNKRITTPFDSDAATRAVVKVGDGGRGFVMEIAEPNHITKGFMFDGKLCRPPRFIKRRLVVTAAHCLPELPPAHPWAYLDEKTYRLLGPLGSEAPLILTECLFVDPVADLAILGTPDTQDQCEEAEAFMEVVEAATVLAMGNPISSVPGWLLSLDGRWTPCTLEPRRGLWIREAKEGIENGMSGSPILLNDGSVVGVVSNGTGTGPEGPGGGPQPRLVNAFPGWMLDALRTDTPRTRKKN